MPKKFLRQVSVYFSSGKEATFFGDDAHAVADELDRCFAVGATVTAPISVDYDSELVRFQMPTIAFYRRIHGIIEEKEED